MAIPRLEYRFNGENSCSLVFMRARNTGSVMFYIEDHKDDTATDYVDFETHELKKFIEILRSLEKEMENEEGE